MNLLDYKSFGAGVLLTITVVLSTGFVRSDYLTPIPWGSNQQWEVTTSNTTNILKGWEPFAYDSNDNFDPLLLRRRIK
jgi:hypothetical protein|tara:strand:+ start:1440 stop:1673 length:234 start_codon:yes stop_codon:yes gene_type:complete